MAENKAVFLDRDGVINVGHPYVHLREEFEFQEGIFELCRSAQRLNYLLIVVTNQSGIARGTDLLTRQQQRRYSIRLKGTQLANQHLRSRLRWYSVGGMPR
jgi:HAD superfamily hydrolase (TIGR01662 family)